MNTFDSLVDYCKEWPKYPRNLLQQCHRPSTLDAYRSSLERPKAKLFDADRENIYFLEPSGSFRGYKEKAIACPDDLEKHLRQNSEDPHYGMIYDTLDAPESEILEIPRLGRSGREHTVQYLLRSVEKSTGPKGDVVWNIRQMAVHHRYDFITGKAFWLNIKAKSIMQDRIKEAITEDPKFNPAPEKGLPFSFAATLMTNLIYLEWCDESWRECINDLEEKIRTVLEKAKIASVPDLHACAIRVLTSRTNTAAAETPEKPTSLSLTCIDPRQVIGKPLTSYLHSALGKSSQETNATPLLPVASNTTGAPVTKTDEDIAKRLKSLKVLETFSVEELQHLHYLGEQLENFRLVMLLNSQTLRDISEHYQDLTKRDNFPQEQKAECARSVSSFARRVERIRKNLEIRVTQIESLRSWLQEGKTLVKSHWPPSRAAASNRFPGTATFDVKWATSCPGNKATRPVCKA
ncbi:hypothetical protein IL306_011899 [Fusarium sp. DS 682]|nr:hypothetical protein IL306_011899 [Fusarium sp. DS 682]